MHADYGSVTVKVKQCGLAVSIFFVPKLCGLVFFLDSVCVKEVFSTSFSFPIFIPLLFFCFFLFCIPGYHFYGMLPNVWMFCFQVCKSYFCMFYFFVK